MTCRGSRFANGTLWIQCAQLMNLRDARKHRSCYTLGVYSWATFSTCERCPGNSDASVLRARNATHAVTPLRHRNSAFLREIEEDTMGEETARIFMKLREGKVIQINWGREHNKGLINHIEFIQPAACQSFLYFSLHLIICVVAACSLCGKLSSYNVRHFSELIK